ncbi:MAG: hypothetical protein COA65_04830 [Rhodospirillaceae bacterium]|nr:MAG: hypothetical protein COA65_04830 [Rhodospirillaceae bacterium]
MDKFNPFLNEEMTKLFKGFAVPQVNTDALAEIQRKNLEVATAVSRLVFEGFQSLTTRQSEIAKDRIESYTKGTEAIAGSKTPEEAATKQADLAGSLFEETVADTGTLTDLATKSATAIFEVVEQRFTEGLDEFRNAAQQNGKAKANGKAPAKAAK